METLPAGELIRKLQVERTETDRLRNLVLEKDESIRKLTIDLAAKDRVSTQDSSQWETKLRAAEQRIETLEKVSAATQQQLEDKAGELEASKRRTSSLMAQLHQSQSTIKNAQYQAVADAQVAVKETETVLNQRVQELEGQVAVLRAQVRDTSLGVEERIAATEASARERVHEAEREMHRALTSEVNLRKERDAAVAHSKEVDAVLEAKRNAAADKMKEESESVRVARETAASRVQREASISQQVRREMESQVQKAQVEASTARQELITAKRCQSDAEARLNPLQLALEKAKAEVESKGAALTASEHALEVSTAEKMKLKEEIDALRVNATRGQAQNEALRRTLLEELETGSQAKSSNKQLQDVIDEHKAVVKRAYEVAEEEKHRAEAARGEAARNKDLLDRQMTQVRNLEAAFHQVKSAVRMLDVRFEGITSLPEEFAGAGVGVPNLPAPPTAIEAPATPAFDDPALPMPASIPGQLGQVQAILAEANGLRAP